MVFFKSATLQALKDGIAFRIIDRLRGSTKIEKYSFALRVVGNEEAKRISQI